MKTSIIFSVLFISISVNSCQKCSSPSSSTKLDRPTTTGACIYDLDTCSSSSKISTIHHKCELLPKKRCLALWTETSTEFCFEKNTKPGSTRVLNISFYEDTKCPPTQPKKSDKGACFYDEEVCRVNNDGTKIETVHHKCEHISQSECQAIQEECDARADECIVTDGVEEDIPTFCFANLAKEGDTRPLNAEFFAGAECPK